MSDQMEMFRKFLRETVFPRILLGHDRVVHVSEALMIQGFSRQVASTAPNKSGELLAMLTELGLADDPDLKFLLSGKSPQPKATPLFSNNQAALKALIDQSDKFGIDVSFNASNNCFSFTLNRQRLEEVAEKVVDRAMRQTVYLKSRGMDAKYLLITRVLVQPFIHHLQKVSAFSNQVFAVPSRLPVTFSDNSIYSPVGVGTVTVTVGSLGGLDIIPVERELDFILVTPDVSKA